jgi:hypothetical protein
VHEEWDMVKAIGGERERERERERDSAWEEELLLLLCFLSFALMKKNYEEEV